MWLRAFSLLIAVLLPSSGHPAEALALKVLGFSSDGRHFGFIQYGGVGDGGEYEAEAFVIDVERDRLVRPRLLIASYREETPHTDKGPYDEWLLAYAEKRFAGELRQYRFQHAGWPIAADEGAQARQSFALSSDRTLSLGPDALEFAHNRLGRVRVALQKKRMPWPRTSRAADGPDAIPCSEEVDWEQGVAFRLTLHRGKRTVVLKDDKTIPASRHCVLGYGITEVHAFARPDGKVSLAVILGMAVRGFEGSDRRFLAVTAGVSP